MNLIVKVWNRLNSDDCADLAAQVSFYFVLSLFPFFLVLASILVFLQNIIQSKEEHALNLGAQYCLDNLINRLYVPK